jgi:hypothetical protein
MSSKKTPPTFAKLDAKLDAKLKPDLVSEKYTYESADGKTHTFDSKITLCAFLPMLVSPPKTAKKARQGPPPSLDFPNNCFFNIPPKDLKKIFDSVRALTGFEQFASGFKKTDGTFDLPQHNGNYPKIVSRYTTNGVGRLTMTFTDANGQNVHVSVILLQYGDNLFQIGSVEICFFVNDEYTTFTVNIDPKNFDFSVLLTKEQVLNLCFRCLGELMLFNFCDYLVEVKRVHRFTDKNGFAGEHQYIPYDKRSLMELFLTRICRKYTIKFDELARTFAIRLKTRRGNKGTPLDEILDLFSVNPF